MYRLWHHISKNWRPILPCSYFWNFAWCDLLAQGFHCRDFPSLLSKSSFGALRKKKKWQEEKKIYGTSLCITGLVRLLVVSVQASFSLLTPRCESLLSKKYLINLENHLTTLDLFLSHNNWKP